MASITKGTAHVYGVAGTITDCSVQSFSLKSEHQNKTTTLDESGNEIENRRDDLVQEGSIVIRVQSGYTVPAAGDQITYDSVIYVIESIDRSETNNAHTVYTLSIRTSEYVTLV